MYLDPSIKPPRWSSKWNFGVTAIVLLALLAMAALLIMPEVYNQ
jgi:hypothetical protein